MNSGKKFENQFKASIDTNEIYFYRLKDNPASYGQDSSILRFTTNNPYDCYCFRFPNLYPIELKSTTTKSFSIQKSKEEKSKMIKLHQIKGLTEAEKYKGIYAGFLFNFSQFGETYWVSIRDFNNLAENNPKKSINYEEIKVLGIPVESKKLKVNYRYNISKLFDTINEYMDSTIGKEDTNGKENI